MKKKFSKILGVSVALALILSLAGIPVAANGPVCGDVDIGPDNTNPLSGLVAFTFDYDGDATPNRMEIEVCVDDLYGSVPYVLGQWDGETTPGAHPFWCDGAGAVIDADFDASANPIATWTDTEREEARQIGFVSAAYDADDKEWTLVFDTTKKCEVCDDVLRAAGWWPGQEVWFDGAYTVGFEMWFDGGTELACHNIINYTLDNDECITPGLGLNAKGAQQKFWLNYIDVVDGVPLDEMTGSVGGWSWSFDPGVNLTTWGDAASPADVKVLAGGRPYTDSYGACHPAPRVYVDDLKEYVCLPDRYIEIQARAPILGDCEIEVWTCMLPDPNDVEGEGADCCPIEVIQEVASAEKKWGELNFSKLDVHIAGVEYDGGWPSWSEVKEAVEEDFGIGLPDPFVKWIEDEDHEVDVSAGGEDECDWVYEKIGEWVFCDFLQLPEMEPAGGAVVHWWLAKDTEDNQIWIQNLMDDIVERAGALGFRGHEPGYDSNDYWSATGSYDPQAYPKDVIMAWVDDGREATNTDLVGFEPIAPGCDPYLWKDPPPEHIGQLWYINPGRWYGRSLTMDYHPGEIPGVTIADLVNKGQEDVLIITFVEYQQDYNGENLVLIEVGKKHFRKPPPPIQVKIPQVRWAGEKIIIEKDWGEDFIGYPVSFTIDQDSIGVLTFIGLSGDWTEYNKVWTTVMQDGVARCIFESEYEGQAEIKCVLYDAGVYVPPVEGLDKVNEGSDVSDYTVIGNHDFPLMYLKLESIEPLDPTPAPVDPYEEAYFGVQVKGWFKTKASELSSRPEKWVDTNPLLDALPNVVNGGNGIVDDDHDLLLPAGRWVLPDDWPTLAGVYELRRWWDLMNNWEDRDSGIFSGVSPFGPYNSKVVTTAFPGLAEFPVIGPFNTTQPVAIEDELVKWVTTASVIADYIIATPSWVPPVVGALLPATYYGYVVGLTPAFDWTTDDLRDTLVPDGKIEWFDCPMSPAKIVFKVAEDQLDTDLFWALKITDIEDYVDWASERWYAPYYAEEIPSSWFIPVGSIPIGYNWDSWGMWTPSEDDDGPYFFWRDLEMTTTQPDTNDEVLEVYSDNNGIAYVGMWELGESGEVLIHAMADYPYMPGKHPPLVSIEVTQRWGAEELNPWFLANKTAADVGETVTFTNETTFGQHPYTRAEWDFDDNGVADTVIEGTEAQVMADVTWEYATADVYNVKLTMRDSAPTTRWEVRLDYITVSGEGILLGDANQDGVVNVLDITYVEMIIAGLVPATPEADANQDGVVNVLDITAIEIIIAG